MCWPRALQTLTPGYDVRAELQTEVDDCLKLTGSGEPLVGAALRGEDRAHYACGAVLLLAAEGGLRRRDPQADALTFWRDFLQANHADGVVDGDDWLAAFERATGDPALTPSVRSFIRDGVSDPAAFIAALFAATGVPHARDGAGVRLV